MFILFHFSFFHDSLMKIFILSNRLMQWLAYSNDVTHLCSTKIFVQPHLKHANTLLTKYLRLPFKLFSYTYSGPYSVSLKNRHTGPCACASRRNDVFVIYYPAMDVVNPGFRLQTALSIW
ncbi:hypothetical protein EG68_11386 [Paragonimus skrjabini miyazakii]|uniref:Uncharacterized protein n=1 Tax=Paragonimus skrjabini miyazakii TaxID=59628 RepID=A0A8S9YJJ7_9TREM|nr:hypothetical protein EG68_11386 [Paragonimus skrjabini miyazakii]